MVKKPLASPKAPTTPKPKVAIQSVSLAPETKLIRVQAAPKKKESSSSSDSDSEDEKPAAKKIATPKAATPAKPQVFPPFT